MRPSWRHCVNRPYETTPCEKRSAWQCGLKSQGAIFGRYVNCEAVLIAPKGLPEDLTEEDLNAVISTRLGDGGWGGGT